MWYAITANSTKIKIREIRKEFQSAKYQIILSAHTKSEIEDKIKETVKKYPLEMEKYITAGVIIVEAANLIEAKRLAQRQGIYIDKNGQYNLF